MFHIKYFFYLIYIHFIIATPQLNLYHTDEVSDALQHNCFHIALTEIKNPHERQIISYCMSELPSKFNVENNDLFSKFTFAKLSKQNITSEQLYLWSAPIDLIEHYQFYLNQFSTENDLSLANKVFYNCTMSRFGPMCQYQLHYHYPNHLSLYEIINDFYLVHEYKSNNFTCYTHLKCNRGPFPSCLDWTEICDGQINCLDGGLDEENCWQLEINDCEDNEYRCRNGQCIPQLFYNDENRSPDCIDGSDVPTSYVARKSFCEPYERPSFRCEDYLCEIRPMTTSCMKNRANIIMEAMYMSENSSVNENCWSAFKCLLKFSNSEYSFCDKLCENDACIKIVENNCPDMLYFPNVPVLFGNIYFAYRKIDSRYWTNFFTPPFYVCYDTSQYDDYFINVEKIFFNNMTCIDWKPFLPSWMLSSYSVKQLHEWSMYDLHSSLKKFHLTINYTSAICNKSNIYQCARSSKCVSIYRVIDNIRDCPYNDDESMAAISNIDRLESFQKTHFKCPSLNKYIHQSSVGDKICNCDITEEGSCADEDLEIQYLKKNIVFQHICDGFIDLVPIMTEERNETDETECEQWQCNNIYTRCNNVWNCPNGADESGCFSHATLNCSSKHHLCVSPVTNQFICLSIEKANDGNVDCLGATDEPTLCGTYFQQKFSYSNRYFYCINSSSQSCTPLQNICNGYNNCQHGDDEQFCTQNWMSSTLFGDCQSNDYPNTSDVEKFLCDYSVLIRQFKIIHFELDRKLELIEDPIKYSENKILLSSSIIQMTDQHQPRCHRGLDLRVWLNNKNNLTTNTCLCPPSFYGSQCQYQNQRISLTIKFRTLASSWQTPFTIVISLIDDSDKRIIHSYQQFTYLSARDCKTKFNSYLIYSTRPKDSKKHYAIHIDFYEKLSLNYRGSVLFPVTFPFLPVHRLAFIVDIPRNDDKTQICSTDECVHGKCINYLNNRENLTFCQCNEGWSGRYCTIQHTCTCASDSLCLGISADNRSICICPINKFGSRCLLTDIICQTNNNSTNCQNNGQCISNIDYIGLNQDFVCICPKGFTGNRCEIADNQLILSFGKDIVLSQEMFIHFIKITFSSLSFESTVRGTTFRTIPIRQDSIIIYLSQPFHIVFIELSNKTYYLTVVQNIYHQSTIIKKMITSSDRCPHIDELFNESFVQWHLLRRIKYYHLPCQQQSLNLSCFYDDVHFCLCYNFQQQRLANCFKFDHNMTFNCLGQSECENGGQCLQDTLDCPAKSVCICPLCFYGVRCQFSTSGFGLSLDAILGYHILSNVTLNQQPFIIKISLSLTIIFVIAGFIDGILSGMTFKNKSVREVGCGLYLLGSSITTLFTTIIFSLKFIILLLAQMLIISNRSFLQIQCYSIDFILRVCLCMDQWLNACVAFERAITTIKGASFVKNKSKQAAKLVIIILLIVIICTSIHDPIYRRLIDEENDGDDEKRIWCIVTYSSNLQIYNYIIQTFHFFGPFIINLFSSIILITKKTRQQLNIHPNQTYKEVLRKQFQQHKHLLTAPIVLIILALPRLIITFVSKCMKSSNDSWLFLCGYFISFVPPMLTFVVFIRPSKFYMKEFRKTVARYRTRIRRRLGLSS